MEIIECVPNISEGKNTEVIKKLADVITSVDGVQLLNVDSGKAANRTVYTFVGFPEAVIEAAFLLYKNATELISMSGQLGEHPRMGVVDVCPLIPIQGIRIEEVAKYAETLAKRVGEELQIPVYLYEQNATQKHRVRLEQIRSGEYEGFETKIQNFDWVPDFGPQIFNVETGVTAIGARNYLLAYNVNLNIKDLEVAKNIAIQIRESGGTYTAPDGSIQTKKPGLLKGVKAIGWYIKDFDVVQVSTNITDFRIIGLARVFEEVSKLAKEYGVEVKGSELVGLVPYEALESAGMYFQYKLHETNTDSLDFAIKQLGLTELKSCKPKEQILEYAAGLQ